MKAKTLKRLVSLLLVVMMVLVLVPALPIAAESTRKELEAPKATPTIDGNKDLGYGETYYINKGHGRSTAAVSFAWDENYVYAYMTVKDGSPDSFGAHNSDMLLWYLDLGNKKSNDTNNEGSAYYTVNLLREASALCSNGQVVSGNSNYLNANAPNGTHYNIDDLSSRGGSGMTTSSGSTNTAWVSGYVEYFKYYVTSENTSNNVDGYYTVELAVPNRSYVAAQKGYSEPNGTAVEFTEGHVIGTGIGYKDYRWGQTGDNAGGTFYLGSADANNSTPATLGCELKLVAAKTTDANQIATVEDFFGKIKGNSDGDYKLVSDLDFSELVWVVDGSASYWYLPGDELCGDLNTKYNTTTFKPTKALVKNNEDTQGHNEGALISEFTGSINGQGHTIKNLPATLFENLGPAGAANVAELKDLKITADFSATSDQQWDRYGVLCKTMRGTKLQNIDIDATYTFNESRTGGGTNTAVGIYAGRANGGTIIMENCTVSGTVTLDRNRSTSTDTTTYNAVGSFFGQLQSGDNGNVYLFMQNCSSDVDVKFEIHTAQSNHTLYAGYVGGLIGYVNMNQGEAGNLELQNCVFRGTLSNAVTGTNAYNGQLIGNANMITFDACFAKDCIYNTTKGAAPAVSGANASKLELKDSNIKFVGAQQRVNASDKSKQDVRFLLVVDGLNYSSVGFIVERGTDKMKLTATTNTVYASILADDETVTAAQLNGKYIVTVVITGVEAGTTFTVTPTITGTGTPTAGAAGSYTVVEMTEEA